MLCSVSSFAEEFPVLDLEAFPYTSRVLDSVSNELTLLSQLQVDLIYIIFAFDVGNIDGDEDIRVVLLES